MAGYARAVDTLKVGSLTVLASVAFSVLFMVMTNRGVSLEQWDLNVRIATAEGLRKRDPVFFRGVNVGEVRSLAFSPVGDVVVRVHLDRRLPLTHESRAELVPLDMFGRQSLVLREGAPDAARLLDGDTIGAASPVSLPNRVADLGDRAGRILNDTTVVLLHAALAGTSAATAQVAALSARMDAVLAAQQESLHVLLEEMGAVARNLTRATDPSRLETLHGEVAGVLHRASELLARLDSTSAEAAALLHAARDGEGSIARLLEDPEFYRRSTALLEAAEALLQDIRADPRKYVSVRVF